MSAKKASGIDSILGKVRPNKKSLEDKVIGIMIMEQSIIATIKTILSVDDFYDERNAAICKAIYQLFEKNCSIDIDLIYNEMLLNEDLEVNVNTVYEIVKLSNQVTGTTLVSAKKYALLIKEASLKRKILEIGNQALMGVYDDGQDVFDTISEIEHGLKEINIELAGLQQTSISNIALNVLSQFEERVRKARENIVDEDSVYTFMDDWDKINGQLFNGLYVVAGRPGMGKGVHMTELICRMGKKYNIGVVNGEMTDEQLLKRIGCNLMGIDNFLFKKDPRNVTDEEKALLHEAMNEALELKLHLTNDRNIKKIVNKIRLWVENKNVKCVFVDFLTLLRVPPELEKYYTKTQQVDYILDSLTQACKDFKVPIILYVQMNREILGRNGSKEPNLGDLKQSGSIEELAFQVSFLHRPEYYDANAITDEMGESTKGLMYQIIAKHRDGVLDRMKFRANLAYSRLENFTSQWTDIPKFENKDEVPF